MMSPEKDDPKDCNAAPRDRDEPKPTLFNFPIDDKERSQSWVDAFAFRASKDLPQDIDPAPSSKCTCPDSVHIECPTNSKAGYINNEHSYNKKMVKGDNVAACTVHRSSNNVKEKGEKIEDMEKKSQYKGGKKLQSVNKSVAKSVPPKDDHMYFVNAFDNPPTQDDDTWSRSATIHQKEPDKVRRKKKFHVFNDTTVSRWTCIPHSSRYRYMSKVIKFHNLEADAKVMDLTKTVNKFVDITYRDNVEEEETEYWDLHSSDSRPNVNVEIKSSWIPTPLTRRPQQSTGDCKKKLCKKREGTLNSTLGLESCQATNKPNQPQVKDDSINPKPNFTARINARPSFKNLSKGHSLCSTRVREVNGIPVRITGPFKNNHSVFRRPTLEALGLSPQSEYHNFDFTNADMSYWHYQCDNGILETIVECKSNTDKSKVVKLPAKELIHQLQLAHKRFQYLKSKQDKRKLSSQMKCRDHVKEIRRLRYKIMQMQKEMDAPKPYEKFLNEDQIEAMDKESLHGHHWKDDTIVLGHNIRLACTTKGYKYLVRKLNWPLPSVKTLIKRAKELHLPFPEAVRTVLVRKPGEGKRNVAKPVPINGVKRVDDDGFNDESKPKSSSVITINPSSKLSSPKLLKVKRKRRTKEEIMRDKLNKGLAVNVGGISNLVYSDQVNYYGEQVVVANSEVTEPKTVKKRKKKKIEEIPPVENEIVIKRVKTLSESEFNQENICFEETIPEFLDENEVYYKFIKLENDQLEEVNNLQGDFIYSDQLQTLADASFIHQSPQKLTDKKIIVKSVNADSPEKNSNQFHKYFTYNISTFDGFSNT